MCYGPTNFPRGPLFEKTQVNNKNVSSIELGKTKSTIALITKLKYPMYS